MAHFWKRILTPGSYGGQNGERETFTEDDLRQIAKNGKLLHEKGFLCPLPKNHRDKNGHLPLPVMLDDTEHLVDAITGSKPAWDPLVNQGFVIDWAYLDSPENAPADLPEADSNVGWLMGKIEIDDSNTDLIDAITKNRVRSTSLGSLHGYRLTAGEVPQQLDGRSPIHLALTLNPKVNNEAGFMPAKALNEHSVALLSQEEGESKVVELSLLDDSDKPPQNPAVAKAKEFEEKPDSPEQQGDDPAAKIMSQIAVLIKAANESGILPLPPDTTPENAIDRIITLLHNHKQQNGSLDEDAPLGEPAAGSETNDTRPSLMSDEANPTVQALLKAQGRSRQDLRRQRAKALVAKNPGMAEYVEKTINPMIESSLMPSVLLDDSGAMVLDPETGAPTFAPEPIDTILDGLEAAPAPKGLAYGDLTQPEAESVAVQTRGDYVSDDSEQETPEDRETINRLAQRMNS